NNYNELRDRENQDQRGPWLVWTELYSTLPACDPESAPKRPGSVEDATAGVYQGVSSDWHGGHHYRLADASNNIKERRRRLWPVEGNDQTWYDNLVRSVMSWHDPESLRHRELSDANALIDDIVTGYQALVGASGFDLPNVRSNIKGGLNGFLDQQSRPAYLPAESMRECGEILDPADQDRLHDIATDLEEMMMPKEILRRNLKSSQQRIETDNLGAAEQAVRQWSGALSSHQYKAMLGELKIILMSAVPDPLTVKALIDGLDAGYRSRKHIITGTFTTNGHSPKILAYHTTQPRPSTKKPAFRTATMRNVLDGIKEMLYNLVALQQADLSEIEFRIGSINPGIANPMTVALQTSETPNAYVEKCQELPGKRFKKGLKHAKDKNGISQLEATIPPF
ncbi:hypothetical protein BGZ97_004273, partial [Linnemannia gamsii]